MRIRTVNKILIISFLLLYAISVLLIYSLGYNIWVSLTWNLLSFIGADFPVDFSIPDKANAIAFLSNVLGVIGSLILTILLTSFFYQILSRVNIKKSIAEAKIRGLKHHTILYPSNKIAEYLAKDLARNKIEFLILDPSKKYVEEYIDEGMLALEGDAFDPVALEKAKIKEASKIILLNEDITKNALAAISAKKMNNKIRIASRIKKVDDIAKMKRIGVDYLVMPEIAIGDEIGKFLVKEAILKKKLV